MSVIALTRPAARRSAAPFLIGESPAIVELRHLIAQVGPSDASILVTGPSGSGKEVVARAIHASSARAGANYVAMNCGAIPRELIESELFGHEKGSFTGAHAQHRGRFEEADGGTLFLDEIGDMPFDMQVKLLRVLEERTISRVGGRGQIAVDTRIVSATHRDIESAIDKGAFREDLFYRLAVFPLALPALKDRREDVALLVAHFQDSAPEGRPVARFSPAALDRLMRHDWPGNVRELRNVVERANILFAGRLVDGDAVDAILPSRGGVGAAERAALWAATSRIPAPARTEKPVTSTAAPERPRLSRDTPIQLRDEVAAMERRYIAEALALSGGVVAEAARMLSLQRTTLIEKMRKYALNG